MTGTVSSAKTSKRSSPVTTVGMNGSTAATMTTTDARYWNELPQIIPGGTAPPNNSDGEASQAESLRLGEPHLVLVNGELCGQRPTAPSTSTTGDPASLVSRIEVVQTRQCTARTPWPALSTSC